MILLVKVLQKSKNHFWKPNWCQNANTCNSVDKSLWERPCKSVTVWTRVYGRETMQAARALDSLVL